MTLRDFIIEPDRIAVHAAPYSDDLACIELVPGQPDGLTPIALPACPVIGLGAADHPMADKLDVIAHTRSDAEAIAKRVVANPLAAATTVQLLRMLPALSLADGLQAESMAYAMLQGSAEHRQWLESTSSERRPIHAAGKVEVIRDGDNLLLTLDRTEAGNAIDRAMRDSLHEAFTLAGIDSDIRTLSLSARGKAFSLGADLAEFGTTSDPATAHAIRYQTLPARALLACADRLEVHIDGACVGAGLEIAAFARSITATARSWFQLPELEMGILPGAGGCVSVSRRIGRQKAAQMILSGKRVSAATVLDWGLIDAIVD